MLKYLAVLLIALAIVQQPRGVDAGGKDEAKKVFHELMKVIDEALTAAQKALDKAVVEVEKAGKKVEDAANGELDKLLDPLRKKLDDLVAKATANGFDVTTCQKYVDDFDHTPDNFVSNLVGCVDTQVEQAQKLMTDALNNAKKIETDLDSIDSDIDNCSGNAVKKAKCYAKIIEEIAEDTKKAPQHIIEDVTKATALIADIVPNLEACSVNQLKKAGEDAAKDVADFAICAAL